MNQKEYEIIAEVFYRQMLGLTTIKQADQWREMVYAVANKLEENYTSFDRRKFMQACGTN